MNRLPSRFSLPRSFSLAAQLLLTFVGLVIGTTVALTVSAYTTSLASLELEARRTVRAAAQARAQTLTQLLELRQQRAEGLLVRAELICAEPDAARGFGWSEDCVKAMVSEFRETERAAGALLTFRNRRLMMEGRQINEGGVPAGGLATVVRRDDGGSDIVMRAFRGDALLTLQFDIAEFLPLFQGASSLGETGEIFLTDAAGRFLTPARYLVTENDRIRTPPGASVAEPFAECRRSAGEVVDIDYRGVRTVHGFVPVAALGGACIDAHISFQEALAPAGEQRYQLGLRGVLFVLIGALLSLLAARWIAAPVRRLAASARALQAGQFDEPVPVAGPSEVRALGHAFAAMAAELAKMVSREQAARREAEAANQSKDQFLAMLSHELRTPLNATLGWARLLRTGQLDADRTQRATEAIERSAEAQHRLIEDLLDVSRIVSGRLRIVRSAVPFAAVTEAALDAVRPQAAEKHVALETSIEDREVLVLGDAQRLQQVVWNLAWNAVKFTPEGGCVSVALRRAGMQVELSVTDTGVGIRPDFLPHVFDWFRQAQAGSGAQSGLGLGLGLVRQLVELHGGTVHATSAGEGQGATFTVRLPVHQGIDFQLDESSRAAGATELEPRLSGIRVLLVDDDAETRDVVRAILEQAGAQVHTTDGAEDARAAVATWKPDVMISDIAMPHQDGYTLMRSLRSASVTTPAIALTAYARREDAERARAAGFQVHMPKPVDAERLSAMVAALAARRKS